MFKRKEKKIEEIGLRKGRKRTTYKYPEKRIQLTDKTIIWQP